MKDSKSKGGLSMANKRTDSHESRFEELFLTDVDIAVRSYAAHSRIVEPGWLFQSHNHPMFELNMVLSGQQLCRADGKEYIMEPGDIVLLKPEVKHECEATGLLKVHYCCVHFDLDEPALRQALCSIHHTYHKAESPLAAALRPILVHLAEAKPTKWEALPFIFQLLTALSRLLSNAPEGLLGSSQESGGLANRIAERLNGLLAERHGDADDDYRISAIAEELGYSAAYCNRIFRKVFGMSPRQYLSKMKLREARLLLLNGELTIDAIAERLGYKDTSQFSKQFKRWTQISPSQYRQMFR
ncbi:helix-turn-helix domain-containing protein [Paenibacillus sp. JSM ZJ436]|uniref:helix-turn-helix transcriptional regulator n=1 Tax=Paenibacillus sp. JSM ZJ436 TaxID=3376190 RepID=UPI0037C53E87